MAAVGLLIVYLAPHILPLSLTAPDATSRIVGNALLLILQSAGGIGVYLLMASIMRLPELPESTGYLLGRFRRRQGDA